MSKLVGNYKRRHSGHYLMTGVGVSQLMKNQPPVYTRCQASLPEHMRVIMRYPRLPVGLSKDEIVGLQRERKKLKEIDCFKRQHNTTGFAHLGGVDQKRP
ncbi:MAG: hypothetical protein Pyrs2KO_30460 [Pyruvatibacter sp.]